MPKANPSELVAAIRGAIQQSGGAAVYLSSRLRTHPRPRIFAVRHEGESYEVWIYIWTLTPGGRETLPNERRIQLTGVKSPLDMNPNGPTLLMGYHPDTKMLAGFDLHAHRDVSGNSDSVQIGVSAIEEARSNGISTYKKTNEEIAVGIRSDHFLAYATHADLFHQKGESVVRYINDDAGVIEASNIYEGEQRREYEDVKRLSRDATFRTRVTSAYGYRCAVTGVQLDLIDAAHILPVAAGGSDKVCNGICLSPTMHRALDAGLIYINPSDLTIEVNIDAVSRLRNEEKGDGLDKIIEYEGMELCLPEDEIDWPSKSNLRKANEYRDVN